VPPPAPDRQSRRIERRLGRLSQPSPKSKPARGRRIAFGAAAVVVAGAVGFGLGWLELRAPRRDVINARFELTSVVDHASTLTSPDERRAALGHIDVARSRLASAKRDLNRSWALKVARIVPIVRAYGQGARTLTDNAAQAADIARELLVRLDDVAARAPLANGTVPLDALDELATAFQSSADGIARLKQPPSGLWGELGKASREFRRLQQEAPDRLRGGADVARVGRAFLGATGGRTYLIAGQNNAEMRDQGMILSYAVMTADKGRLAVGRHGRITDLAVKTPVDVELPAGTRSVFSDAPRSLWQNVNITADFSLSGRLMTALYSKSTSSAIDGVIALDVPALSRLLSVLGPVTVPGLAEQLSAENAPRLLLHDLYNGLASASADQEARYERLGEAVNALLERVRFGSFDVAALGVALAEAARGGHFRLYSGHADEQRVFERRGLSGGPAVSEPDRTFHLAVQNGTATKLDYYVKPAVDMDIRVGKDGAATVRTKVTLRNEAPADAGPSYQLGPDGVSSTKAGRYVARVGLWGPAGSDQLGAVSESGLELTQQTLPVEAGTSQVVEFTTVIPHALRDGRLQLRLVPQPRLDSVPLTITLHGLKGDRLATNWDRTLRLSWGA